MTKILNCTLHTATRDQINDGVYEPVNKDKFLELLEFKELPGPQRLSGRISSIIKLILVELGLESLCVDGNYTDFDWRNGPRGHVMIGGAAYMMPGLAIGLRREGIKVVYSFTQRVNEEVTMPDGSVKKTQVFKHIGFVGLK